MPAKRASANNHLQEAMALLVRNQAAFVEQTARNDQERLALQRRTEDWQKESDARFARIEAQLVELPKKIVQRSSINFRESRKRSDSSRKLETSCDYPSQDRTQYDLFSEPERERGGKFNLPPVF
jgi:hypothetical protein